MRVLHLGQRGQSSSLTSFGLSVNLSYPTWMMPGAHPSVSSQVNKESRAELMFALCLNPSDKEE